MMSSQCNENKIMLHYTEQTCMTSWCSPPGLHQCLVEQMDDVIGCEHYYSALGAVIVQGGCITVEFDSRSRPWWNPFSRCCWSRISMSAEQERGCSLWSHSPSCRRTHTHTQAGHPHREEKHIEREGGWYFGRSEKHLIANADLAGNVYFFVLQHKEVDCVSFQGWRMLYICLCVMCAYVFQWIMHISL